MKKTISIFSILVVLIAAMTFIVSAETIKVDFNQSYIINKAPLTLRYNPENVFLFARACTDLSVANDQTGFAEVAIRGNNGKSRTKRVVDKNGNMITTGVVELDGATYATLVKHTAFRQTNSTGQYANYSYDVINK